MLPIDLISPFVQTVSYRGSVLGRTLGDRVGDTCPFLSFWSLFKYYDNLRTSALGLLFKILTRNTDFDKLIWKWKHACPSVESFLSWFASRRIICICCPFGKANIILEHERKIKKSWLYLSSINVSILTVVDCLGVEPHEAQCNF